MLILWNADPVSDGFSSKSDPDLIQESRTGQRVSFSANWTLEGGGLP
jgi:hypothetical protein